MEALDVVMKLAAVTVSAEEIERQGLGNRE
jgi:hypothetical protein